MNDLNRQSRAARRRALRRLAKVTVGGFVASALLSAAHAQGLPATQLPTGKQITQPLLGTTQDVGSLPVNTLLTPDGKYAITSDIGFREYLTVIDTTTGKLAQPITASAPQPTNGSVPGPPTSKSLLAFGKPYSGKNGLYYGLAVAKNTDGTYTVYASQGANNSIAVVTVNADGSLSPKYKTIAMKPGDFPAGLSLDAAGKLYVAVNTNTSNGLRRTVMPGSLVIYDTKNSTLMTARVAPEFARVYFNGALETFGQVLLPSNTSLAPGILVPFTPTDFPYAVAALSSGKKVYVSSQRDGGVYSISLTNPAKPVKSFIPTGSHPISLLLNKAQTLLYVANAQDDTVSQITTANDSVAQSYDLRPAQAAALPGVTPTSLALSPDENTLYATLGDMNAVAVVSLGDRTVSGYIPTGWYPGSVAYVPASQFAPASLLVANGKGSNTSHVFDTQGSLLPGNGTPAPGNPNPKHIEDQPSPPAPQYEDTYYDETIIEGNVQTIPVPTDPTMLANDTSAVLVNNNLGVSDANDTLRHLGLSGTKQIKHVIYIVKENRTYDQVLGDEAAGNGDSNLTIFGKTVTPNLHAIAERFGLFDNFYDCAEVSGDGWNWSTQGIANEYVLKNVPNEYSSRGRNYDFEGTVNNYLTSGFPATGPDGQQNSTLFPNGQQAIPDPDTAPNGYIWDSAEKAGRSFRNYGFFLSGNFGGSNTIFPDNYPGEKGLQPGGHYTGGALDPNVAGHSDVDFREFDTDYPDSDAPSQDGSPSPYGLNAYGKFNAPDRFAEWNREFRAMLTADPTGNSVPNLETIKFMSDHTAGFGTGAPTPTAHVADNDYAVAELVQAVSNSPIWNSTAIFVIEDDAQNGPDHVDCHRSTAYVISPYIKANTLDHGFHNTDSVLHSIALLLGLPPLSQYDAFAPTFGSDFDTAPNNSAVFTAIPENTGNVYQTASAAFLKAHPEFVHLAKLTSKMDFSQEDKAPAGLLNEIIWKSVRGYNSKMPAPRHDVFPAQAPHKAGAKSAKTVARDADGD